MGQESSCADCGCPPSRHNAVNQINDGWVAHCAACGCCWRSQGTDFVDEVRRVLDGIQEDELPP